MSGLTASVGLRLVGTPRGAQRPHVVLSFGDADVEAWRIPDSDLAAADADPDGYADRVAAEKLRRVFDFEERADGLYAVREE